MDNSNAGRLERQAMKGMDVGLRRGPTTPARSIADVDDLLYDGEAILQALEIGPHGAYLFGNRVLVSRQMVCRARVRRTYERTPALVQVDEAIGGQLVKRLLQRHQSYAVLPCEIAAGGKPLARLVTCAAR
jgi:hypothetical protein